MESFKKNLEEKIKLFRIKNIDEIINQQVSIQQRKNKNSKEYMEKSLDIKSKDYLIRFEDFVVQQLDIKGRGKRSENIFKFNNKNIAILLNDFLNELDKLTYEKVANEAKKDSIRLSYSGEIEMEKIRRSNNVCLEEINCNDKIYQVVDGKNMGHYFEAKILQLLKKVGFNYKGHSILKRNNIDIKNIEAGSFILEHNGRQTHPDILLVTDNCFIRIEIKTILSGNSLNLANSLPKKDTLYILLKNGKKPSICKDKEGIANNGFCSYFFGNDLINEQGVKTLQEFKKQDTNKTKSIEYRGTVSARKSTNFIANLTNEWNTKFNDLFKSKVRASLDPFDTQDNDDKPCVTYTLNINLFSQENNEIINYCKYIYENSDKTITANMFYHAMLSELNQLNLTYKKEKIEVKRVEAYKSDMQEICYSVNHIKNCEEHGINIEDYNKCKYIKMYKNLNDNRYICHICLARSNITQKPFKYIISEIDTNYYILLHNTSNPSNPQGDVYVPVKYYETGDNTYYYKVDNVSKQQDISKMFVMNNYKIFKEFFNNNTTKVHITMDKNPDTNMKTWNETNELLLNKRSILGGMFNYLDRPEQRGYTRLTTISGKKVLYELKNFLTDNLDNFETIRMEDRMEE